MSRHGNKALLLFSGGEITPLLAGRTDVERLPASGCRSLQNMVIEVAGPVTRRPGTLFVAGAKVIIPLTYASLAGTAEYYGITELGDVSDPPRKYRQLITNYGATYRESLSLSPTSIFPAVGIVGGNLSIPDSFRVRYDITGTRNARLGVGTDASYVDTDSLETEQSSGNAAWDPYPPNWVRSKKAKYFTGFTEVSDETNAYTYAFGVPSQAGIAGTDYHWFVTITWMTTFWRLAFTVGYLQPTGAGTTVFYVRAALANGNQNPGEPLISDSVFGSLTHSGSLTFTRDIPPDTSARFLLSKLNGFGQGPGGAVMGNEWEAQQWPMEFVDSADPDTDLTQWFYFPATDALVREYRESLSVEDTLSDAIQRSSGFVAGSEEVATTLSLTGGLTAESPDPIVWTGTIVNATKVFSGLTAGNIYSVAVLVRTNTTGLTDFVNSIDATGANFTAVAPTHVYTFEVRAPLGFDRKALDMSSSDLGATPTAPTVYDEDTILYWGRVLGAGGTLSGAELTIANDLILALKAASLWTKTVYLLPLLGGFNGILVPLRDRDEVGNATNTAFVSGNYALATGLQGNGTSKRLTIARNPSELGTTNNGGLFWWELSFTGTGSVEPMGCYNTPQTTRFVLDLRTNVQGLRWGNAGNIAGDANTAANVFYHGERRSATDREMYRNGVSIGTNTTSDTSSGANNTDISAWGSNNGDPFWPGRGGVAGLTDGTLTDADALALYEILRDELLTPTGRI